jgi:hypothetical protein
VQHLGHASDSERLIFVGDLIAVLGDGALDGGRMVDALAVRQGRVDLVHRGRRRVFVDTGQEAVDPLPGDGEQGSVAIFVGR